MAEVELVKRMALRLDPGASFFNSSGSLQFPHRHGWENTRSMLSSCFALRQ
jgi:hypothetical protein